MLSRQITAVSIAALLLTTSAAAQDARLELGTFGNYTAFGNLVQLEDKLGVGGRLGLFFMGRLELEAATSVIGTNEATGLLGDVTYFPIRARLIYNRPVFGGLSLLLGAGYVRNQYRVNGTWSRDNGVGGLLGMRLNFGRRFALRVDGTADYLPDLSDIATTTRDNMNLGLEAGISLLFGGSGPSYDDWDDFVDKEFKEPPPRLAAAGDADSDGVLDDRDRCRGTPAGVTVDDEGCAVSKSAAARPARWEFGSFGNYTAFGDSVQLEDKFGFGGRLGFRLLGRLQLEAATSITSTTDATGLLGDITYVPMRARLLYNQGLFGGLSLMLGAGYVRNQYSVSGTSSSDNGVGGLLGMRLNLGRRFALRVDGTADRASDDTNLGLEAGMSLLLGGGPSYDDWEEPQPVLAAVDADSDGVLDDIDRCPGTPADVTVDVGGCPISMEIAGIETDSDADGVLDDLDRCPNTAMGEAVDADGCAILVLTDTDGDGIVDPDDACPYTAMDVSVDATGCPVVSEEEALSEEDIERLIRGGVTFNRGTWELTPDAHVTLDGVAQALRADPSLRLELAGYTDSTGSQGKNVWLSWTRAEAVKLYLRRKGIARDRLVTRGYGPDNPVASNDTVDGRAKNRRVELRRLD